MNTTRRIGPLDVAPIGLGCMGLDHGYGPPAPDAVGERVLLEALDLGVTLFDTAALYGFGANETRVGRVLKPHRSRIVLASKGGMAGVRFDDGMRRVIDGRPEAIRRNCEDSLRRLQTDVIDLYYLHRWDKRVPVEDSVGAMADLVRAGKVRAIGLSEVSAATLERAHAVHPVAAVQSEYSPWTRNPEIAVLDACRRLGAALVAFSPVARGFLCGPPLDPSSWTAGDIRRTIPRFDDSHRPRNEALLGGWRDIADAAGCTPAQLALAWLLSRGDHVVPIPGTTNADHLREDVAAAAVAVPAAQLAAIDALINERTVDGARYAAQGTAEVDTETF